MLFVSHDSINSNTESFGVLPNKSVKLITLLFFSSATTESFKSAFASSISAKNHTGRLPGIAQAKKTGYVILAR